MRNIKILLPAISFLLLISACKKDKLLKPEDIRLKDVQTIGNGITSRLTIEYDIEGRITKVANQQDNKPPVTIFNVSYAGNEIILVDPPISNTNAEVRDTIRFLLNADKSVARRTSFFHFEVFGPANPPQRTFTYDTTLYQYDATGLLLKELRSIQDSTWFNNGAVTTTNAYTTGVAIHAFDQGKLVSVNYTSNTSTISRTPTNVYTHSTSSSLLRAFEYGQAFPNKTDFSNAAILNELDIFNFLPMSKHYALLPSRMNLAQTEKDQNGNVTFSSNSTRNYEFTYNLFGFVSSSMNPEVPDYKQSFIYSF